MSRKLIIFGNGLGMALDHTHFSLSTALESVWNRKGFLSVQQKHLIGRCLGRSGAPEGEHELDLLHQAVTHCKALTKIGTGNEQWLNVYGQEFPLITATYIHKVATTLHNYTGQLPEKFENDLVDFIKTTKSHVATLNYDKLLYESFLRNNIFSGYEGYLVDGMLNQGFSSEALERKYGKSFGLYLHLHGSPLFVNKDNKTVKLPRWELTADVDEASEHIVLTHVKHKPSVISASHLLSTYWEYLHFALLEAEEIILFGYSGLDEHLNIILRPYFSSKKWCVVEWSGAGEKSRRKAYWSTTFGHKATVVSLDNITDFTQW